MALYLYGLAIASLAGIVAGAATPDCCRQKTVGGRLYVLAGVEDTSGYNCLTNCVYKIEADINDPMEKLFCFAAGDLEVVCGDGGEPTEKPGGNEEPAPGGAPTLSPASMPAEGPSDGGDNGSCSYPDGHTMAKYPGPAAECGYDLKFSGLDQASKDLLLAKHNELRQKVAAGNEAGQPGASNMRKLVWNDELGDIAQRWAGQCQFGHDDMRNLCDGTSVGQNAYLGETSNEDYPEDVMPALGDAVQAWYDEVTNPGFSSADINPYNFGDGWGHYTQVAWADTAELGCGMVYYEGHDQWFATLVVCNYAVAGNLIGAPMYLTGAGCGDCPAGTTCDSTFDALCV